MPESNNLKPARQFASSTLGVVWWYFLVRGLLSLAVGLFLLFKPDLGAKAFAQVIGVLILVDGLLSIVAGIKGQSESRGWTILRGLLLALLGIFVFSQPAFIASITVTTVLYIISAFVLIAGILEIAAVIKGHHDPEAKTPSLLGGVLTIAFALLLFFAPISFGLMIVRIIGVVTILIGAILLFVAMKSRKLQNHIKS